MAYFASKTAQCTSICMCQKGLDKENNVYQGDICQHCCRLLSPVDDDCVYICPRSDCIYKRTSTVNYYICTQCYNTNDSTNNTNIETLQVQFICNKTLSSLNAIS